MMGRVFGSIGDNVQNDGYLFEYNYVLGSPWRFNYEGGALTPYKARFDIKTNESHAESLIWGPIEELVRLVNEHVQRHVRADDRRRGSICRRSCATSPRRTSSLRTMGSTATTA